MLTISSKNYSSWSLRGWLLCQLAGLEVEEQIVSLDDPDEPRRAAAALARRCWCRASTTTAPSVWDTLAIAEYLAELYPEAGMLPEDRIARAHCRSISGEMHSGFHNLRSALPMNLKAQHKSFKIFAGAQPDIDRVQAIWSECLERYGGPFLFGEADRRRRHVRAGLHPLPHLRRADRATAVRPIARRSSSWPPMKEWIEAAKTEPEELEELDVEF